MKLFKKYHIVACPRSGATAYGNLLAKQKKINYYNEPFSLHYYSQEKYFEETKIGGGQFDKNEYIMHSICSDYLNYKRIFLPQEKVIFIERKNKWQQLLSYLIMYANVIDLKSNRIHNLSFKKSINLNVNKNLIQLMFMEWNIFALLKKQNEFNDYLFYEDLDLNESDYQKNSGYEHISFENLDVLKKYYKFFWNTENEVVLFK